MTRVLRVQVEVKREASIGLRTVPEIRRSRTNANWKVGEKAAVSSSFRKEE
jgi:hypothetical protein